MIIDSIKALGYAKRRPKSHKQEGYTVGGNPGYVIAAYPRDYPMTNQQKKVRDAARSCGIKKGMSRKALMDAMITCIPGKV